MTENRRFTRSNTYGWKKGAFLEVMNGLNEKNRKLKEENKSLKLKNKVLLEDMITELEKFEHTGENIRLSINIKTGELQRHICATGVWFGDFDRVLVKNFINEKDYQSFIDRVIEVYNTEFKGDDLND